MEKGKAKRNEKKKDEEVRARRREDGRSYIVEVSVVEAALRQRDGELSPNGQRQTRTGDARPDREGAKPEAGNGRPDAKRNSPLY